MGRGGGGGGDLTKKSQERGGWKICWRVGDIQRRLGFRRKVGDSVSLGIFPSWGVANVTIVTFNYILVIVFLFPLNVGVSPCFHCTVLVPVYRVYTSCFLNTVVSSCYRLHNSVCTMQVLLVSVLTCGFNLFLKCVISQEFMRVHTCGQSMLILTMISIRTHSVLKTHSFYRL